MQCESYNKTYFSALSEGIHTGKVSLNVQLIFPDPIGPGQDGGIQSIMNLSGLRVYKANEWRAAKKLFSREELEHKKEATGKRKLQDFIWVAKLEVQ